MEKRALTNHLRIQINRDAFFQKYSVYRIQTDEDYIRQDARILDLPCLDNRVLGISNDKATMYVMLPAGHDYTFELQNAIKEEDTGGHLIVDKASSVDVPEYTILKLLRQGLGVAPIAIDPPYSNLTGRLFEVVAKKKDILICLDETSTTCTCQAVVDTNHVGDVAIFGYYINDVSLDAIRKEVINGSLTVSAKEIGKSAVDSLEEYLSSGFTNEYASISIESVTPENVDAYGEEEETP